MSARPVDSGAAASGPHKGLQATANSVRSSLAPVVRRVVIAKYCALAMMASQPIEYTECL
jgi:hypothetical protein